MPRKKRRRKIFRLSKRRKFVLISVLLALGLLGMQYIFDIYRYIAILILTIITYGLVIWSLKEDLRKAVWYIVPVLPAFFTASIGLFYFLLPEKIITRIVLFVLFGVGMYALLLTENIYTVSSIRTIQLLRAAHALGFVFTLFILFLFYDAIFSFKFDPWINMGLVLVVTLPVLFHAVWSTTLQEKINKEVVSYSLALSWFITLASFFISLWPLTIIIASLFLVTIVYVGLGIIQQALQGRLFKKTINEYLRVGILVMIIIIFAARWSG